MGTKKIAYEITIGIPQATVKEITGHAEEYLLDNYELKIKLKDNEAVQKLIHEGLKRNLLWSLDNLYGDEVVENDDLEKLFKKEIQEVEDKYEAKRLAEEEAARAERIKTAGVLRMHPEQLAKAKKLLKDAGIEATI